MIDPSNNETQAMQSVLRPLGDFVATIGMQKTLADYTQPQVLQLIEVVVTAYQDRLRALTPNDTPFLSDDMPF
jgi:hypothetical protein